MKLLVLNLIENIFKYQFVSMPEAKVLVEGACYCIGDSNSCLKYIRKGDNPIILERDIYNFGIAIKEIIKALTDESIGVISDISEIDSIACCVSYAGEKFGDAVLINDNNFEQIKNYIEKSSLNCDVGLEIIKASRCIMPSIPVTAVFDRSYQGQKISYVILKSKSHGDLTCNKWDKLEPQGITHKFVVRKAATFLNKPIEKLKIISCNLGVQSSIFALNNGKPLSISEKSYVYDSRTTDLNLLNDNDKSMLVSKAESTLLNFSQFSIDAKMYIGSFAALMGGIDAIVFTGTDNENTESLRHSILREMNFFGIDVNWGNNKFSSAETVLSNPDSKVKVLMITSNDELAIAREVFNYIKPVYDKEIHL